MLSGPVSCWVCHCGGRATRRYKEAGLPRYLTHEQVEQVLAACDRSTEGGRRDKAIVSILAGLGLRAGEVAALRLDDFNWPG